VMPLPIWALTLKHALPAAVASPSLSFKMSEIWLLVNAERSAPVICRLIFHLPHAPGGVASVTILETNLAPPPEEKWVP